MLRQNIGMFLLLVLPTLLLSQDSLVVQYNYKLEHSDQVLPRQEYAQVFDVTNQKESAVVLPDILFKLYRTWTAKKTNDLVASDFTYSNSRIPRLDIEGRQSIARLNRVLSQEREVAIYPGGFNSRDYDKNKPQKIDPYKTDCDSFSNFYYLVPVIHEVDFVGTTDAVNGQQDTLEQLRIFLQKNSILTLGTKQWHFSEAAYCFGYNVPDTVHNTRFYWTVKECIPIVFNKEKLKDKKQEYSFKGKRKCLRLGGLQFIFKKKQKVYTQNRYMIACSIRHKGKVYFDNIFLGRDSELNLGGLHLRMIEVGPNEVRLNCAIGEKR